MLFGIGIDSAGFQQILQFGLSADSVLETVTRCENINIAVFIYIGVGAVCELACTNYILLEHY